MWKRVGVCAFFVVALVLSLVSVRCSDINAEKGTATKTNKTGEEGSYRLGYSSSNYQELVNGVLNENQEIKDVVGSLDLSKLDDLPVSSKSPEEVFNCRVGDTFSVEDISNHEYLNVMEVMFVKLADDNTAVYWQDGYCFVVGYSGLSQNIMLNPGTIYTLGFFSESCLVDDDVIYIRSEVLE